MSLSGRSSRQRRQRQRRSRESPVRYRARMDDAGGMITAHHPAAGVWDEVGYITVGADDGAYYVGEIFVRGGWDRRGIGTMLYRLAAREAARRGFAFYSDDCRSPLSERRWRAFRRKGWAVYVSSLNRHRWTGPTHIPGMPR